MELSKQIKLICQNAWRVETNTTMNSMMEFIVRETSELLLDEIDMQKSALADALEQLDEVYALANTLKDELEELRNVSKNGGVQKSQRNTKALNETTGNEKARKVNGTSELLRSNA